MTAQDAIHALWTTSIATPIDLKTNGARDIAVALNLSLAGIFALYLKTHMSGAHFRDSHLLRSHHKLIYFNEVDGGGHFAAWEQPELFSAGYEQRSDHCANRREMNGAHDVRPYSHNPHGNIFVAINPGPRRTNNQGD